MNDLLKVTIMMHVSLEPRNPNIHKTRVFIIIWFDARKLDSYHIHDFKAN